MRDFVDRVRIPRGRFPKVVPRSRGSLESWCAAGFRVTDVTTADWASFGKTGGEETWHGKLTRKADMAVAHRLGLFNLTDHDLGDPIDWNRDHGRGIQAPMRFSPSIDYRDRRETGDAKFVWEPNRHHQLVVLGRAYRATGNSKYSSALLEQIDSWIRQCPFGMGMNWRSPLELAIRLINWVWALDLIRDAGLPRGGLRERWFQAAYLHLWEIVRKYSRGSSANNHLVGEAAGVYIGSGYFRNMADLSEWREESRKIVEREIFVQTYPDGACREQAMGYHLFALQFFLLSGIVARRMGEDFRAEYWERLEKMFEFVAAMAEGGPLPMFGDSDDGYVLDLGAPPAEVPSLLAAGAVLFGRQDFRSRSESFREPAFWLFGVSGRERFEALEWNSSGQGLESRAFSDAGYYLLQSGRRGSGREVSVLFDCGELGFGSIAAHGHADALSFTMRISGVDVFVDPGTYDYFSYPAWREYFRCTRAHNTLTVDDRDQSVILGPFLWGARASARCLKWEPGPRGGVVEGEHDGYARLPDPVRHRRILELDGPAGELGIRDILEARGSHKVAIHFHLSEMCRIHRVEDRAMEIDAEGRKVLLLMDPGLEMKMFSGCEEPIGGWVSRGYHRKVPSTTIIGQTTTRGNGSYLCRVRFG